GIAASLDVGCCTGRSEADAVSSSHPHVGFAKMHHMVTAGDVPFAELRLIGPGPPQTGDGHVVHALEREDGLYGVAVGHDLSVTLLARRRAADPESRPSHVRDPSPYRRHPELQSDR